MHTATHKKAKTFGNEILSSGGACKRELSVFEGCGAAVYQVSDVCLCAQPSTPDSELGPRLPPGPTWIVGSEAIISASISSTGLGTVLSYMLIRSPIDNMKSAFALSSLGPAVFLSTKNQRECYE